jgi:MFS family permease
MLPSSRPSAAALAGLQPPAARPPGPGARLVRWLETTPVPRAPGYGRDTSLLLWAWLLWGAGQGLWSYLWPVYLASLGASSVEIGLAASVNFVVATLCYVPGGFVAQLGRHKWQLTYAHLLPVVAVASYGLAGSWWHVLPGMVLSSLVALAVPAVNSLIAQIADDDGIPAPRVFTIIGAGLYAAMAITPPIGGWIGDRFGMGAIFPLVSLCYAASVCCMGLIRSRDLPQDAAAGEQSSVKNDNEAPSRAAPPAAGAGRRGALSAGFGAYRELLRAGSVRLFLLTAFLTHGAMHLGLSFSTLYLGDVYGYDRAQIGWAGSAASAGTVALLLTMERFRRRRGPLIAMWLACAFMAMHFGLTIVSPIAIVQLVGFLCRGGFQSVATQTTVALTEAVSRARLAPATALLATVVGLAAIVGPPAGGWFYGQAPQWPFVAAIATLAASLPLVTRAFRSPPAAARAAARRAA